MLCLRYTYIMAYSHHKTLKSILILFFAMFGVLIAMSAVYVLYGTSSSGPTIGQIFNANAPVSDSNPTQSSYPCWHVDNVATTTDDHGVYTTGLRLFVQQVYDKPDASSTCPATFPVISYIEDGVVSSGVYAGYHRVIGFRTWDGPYGDIPTPYFFITKDYKTYKIVTHPLTQEPLGYGKTVASHLAAFQAIVDARKVTGLADDIKDKINFSFAHTLPMGSLTYVLTRINTELGTSSALLGTTSQGYEIYSDVLDSSKSFGTYASSSDAAIFARLRDYYVGTTKIYVRNTSGIVAEYKLTLPTKKILPRDAYAYPSLLYAEDIKTKESIFDEYNQVTPTPCGMSPDMYVAQNIADADVRKIGTHTTGLQLYTFTDVNHPILTAEYKEKISQYDKTIFGELNNNAPIPTYAEYVAKHPVLLFKDAWNRWVVVGEYDYKLDGGCGKPVIYLYPKTTTNVRVNFKHVVQLTTDIPEYSYGMFTGWSVQAEPDGTLHDVSIEAQDKNVCDQYKKSHPGSEYALDACKRNEYPYIYWAGNTFETYPSMKEGFVVRAKNLKKTLEEKLTQIGLTDSEINDMVSYWYPEMMQKNAPFYRISFMQTQALNTFIPMNIIPRPDTMIRVFLDWEPLRESIPLAPQQLVKTPRQGFTYVEWGGLRR